MVCSGGRCSLFFFLDSGIHPTIAGVLFAITIPVKPKMDSKVFKEKTEKRVRALEDTDIEHSDPLEDEEQRKIFNSIRRDTKRSGPPILRLENALTWFNAFFIIPVFTLANAGVKLDVGWQDFVSSSLGLGILLGLAAGKVAGISLFAYLGKKLGISKLHSSLGW